MDTFGLYRPDHVCHLATDRSCKPKQSFGGACQLSASGREHHFVQAADSGLSSDS